MKKIGNLTQEAFQELCAEKEKEGYRFDRIDWARQEIHFKERYPGAVDDAKRQREGR